MIKTSARGWESPELHLQFSLLLGLRRSEGHQLNKTFPAPSISSLCSPHPGTRDTWVSEERGRETPDREDALSVPGGKEKEIQGSWKQAFRYRSLCINRRNQRICYCPSFILKANGICHRPHPRGKGRASPTESVKRHPGKEESYFLTLSVSLAYSTRMTQRDRKRVKKNFI